MNVLLALDRVACIRGERLLFEGLSLALNRGEALWLRGPNGAGKSSLIRLAAGLLRPAAGTIERRERVALIDEASALDAELPLRRALDFWARVDTVDGHAVDRAMAEAALETMPDVFKPHIEGVVISVEEFADDEVLKSLDIEHPYDLTGLYEGRPLTERSIGESGGMPDRVTLYRIPILVEWIEAGEKLEWLVRHVLIHEIGHHFGFSDDDMHALEDMA